MSAQFPTNLSYQNRESKAKYIWNKYQSILSGSSILDVGADECSLRAHLPTGATYEGIGFGNVDKEVNLEHGLKDYDDNSFDVVLCLDVLEHIENVQDLFDDLCRVSKQYVIIVLPNPWSTFWFSLLAGKRGSIGVYKFYGLPNRQPDDRHRWFFNYDEAEYFYRTMAAKNSMNVLQIDEHHTAYQSMFKTSLLIFGRFVMSIILRNRAMAKNLYAGQCWVVLKKMQREL
jgi:SAM-dependent methyltransferase